MATNHPDREALIALAEKWRTDAEGVTAMGYSQQGDRIRDCADELDAALSAAPRPDLEAAMREALTWTVRHAAADAVLRVGDGTTAALTAWQDTLLAAIRPALSAAQTEDTEK